jgi:hypothetical protein
MSNLTACGSPFGSACSTLPDGAYDSIWKEIKKHLFHDEAFKKVQTETLIYNIPKDVCKIIISEMLRNAFPKELSDSDFERYSDELITMIYTR